MLREPPCKAYCSVRRTLSVIGHRRTTTLAAAAGSGPVCATGSGANCEPDEALGSPRREAYFLYVDRRGLPSNEVWRRKLPVVVVLSLFVGYFAQKVSTAR